MTASSHHTVDSLICCDRSREARQIVQDLQTRGFVAYLAGGCVRDALLGLLPKDFDVATDATPEAIRKVFGKRRTLTFGAAFGVIGVLPGRPPGEPAPAPEPIEVATFRSDGTYSDGRRPDSVHFGNAEQDALRRDFTINGMFYDPQTHQVIDYVGGRADIEAGLLRTIGEPTARFREDKLRMLRAVRFTTALGFRKEPQTFDAIRLHASEIRIVSDERVGAEIRRILVADRAPEGLRQLLDTGLGDHVWPGLETVDLPLATHLLAHRPSSARALGEPFPVSLAVVLLATDDPIAKLESVTPRWRLSNDERRAVTAAVRDWQIVAHARRLRWSKVQPVLTARDAKTVVDLAETCVAARFPEPDDAKIADESIRFVRDSLALPPDQLDPPPLLTGNDLKRSGLRPGPHFRSILKTIRDAQLDAEIDSRDQATELASRLADSDRS